MADPALPAFRLARAKERQRVTDHVRLVRGCRRMCIARSHNFRGTMGETKDWFELMKESLNDDHPTQIFAL